MTDLIEKYFGLEKIQKIAKEKSYDEISFAEYIRFIDQTIKDEEKYGFDEESEISILSYGEDYMSFFVQERERGFSVIWAKEYAYRYLMGEERNAPAFAYWVVKKENQEQAFIDLSHYAELTNRDEFFIRHFAFLIEFSVPNATPSVEHQAIEYSRIYKQEIAKGKSEIFANQFADQMAAGEYVGEWSYISPEEYEKWKKPRDEK